ncbi:hypothetical protein AOLI_G00031840 [Acnodon oligacanthus]
MLGLEMIAALCWPDHKEPIHDRGGGHVEMPIAIKWTLCNINVHVAGKERNSVSNVTMHIREEDSLITVGLACKQAKPFYPCVRQEACPPLRSPLAGPEAANRRARSSRTPFPRVAAESNSRRTGRSERSGQCARRGRNDEPDRARNGGVKPDRETPEE